MSAVKLLGEPIAAAVKEAVAARAAALRGRRGMAPTLGLVASADESAQIYAKKIQKDAAALGIEVALSTLASAATTADAVALVSALARRSDIHGILLQTPLPSGVDAAAVAEAIPASKDVDGASTASAGFAALGRVGGYFPATAASVLELVKASGVSVAGARALVLGRSAVVGRPAAFGLLSMDATVTVAHSRTRELADRVREAEILVVAIGKPAFVQEAWVRAGALVIDVGMHRISDAARAKELYHFDAARLAAIEAKGSALVGDCHPAVERVAGRFTPVPGGVGPLTSALLLRHVVDAAERSAP